MFFPFLYEDQQIENIFLWSFLCSDLQPVWLEGHQLWIPEKEKCRIGNFLSHVLAYIWTVLIQLAFTQFKAKTSTRLIRFSPSRDSSNLLVFVFLRVSSEFRHYNQREYNYKNVQLFQYTVECIHCIQTYFYGNNSSACFYCPWEKNLVRTSNTSLEKTSSPSWIQQKVYM